MLFTQLSWFLLKHERNMEFLIWSSHFGLSIEVKKYNFDDISNYRIIRKNSNVGKRNYADIILDYFALYLNILSGYSETGTKDIFFSGIYFLIDHVL